MKFKSCQVYLEEYVEYVKEFFFRTYHRIIKCRIRDRERERHKKCKMCKDNRIVKCRMRKT